MHLFHISQCTIQNRKVHISVLDGALWDMAQVHYVICEIDLLALYNNQCMDWVSFVDFIEESLMQLQTST